MIARAMNTRPDERFAFRQLARHGACVVRSLQADRLPRLADLAPPLGAMTAELHFFADADGRTWVSGTASVRVRATCQRCLESDGQAVNVDFRVCVVTDPALATRLAGQCDVLMAGSDSLTVAEVVEDELILSLPERLCVQEPCPRAPAMAYPADTGAAAEVADSPFHALSILKQKV